MSLAEVVHAGQANRENWNQSFLDVAQVDIKVSVLLKAELKAIEQGTSKAVGLLQKNQISLLRITESYTTWIGSRKPYCWPGG